MLGSTTVLSRTEVDGVGTTYDAERVSESRRELRQAPELRRMVKYRQGIAIIDTADPILFRFLPRADTGEITIPSRRVLDPPQTLAEAVQAMREIREAQASVRSETKEDDPDLPLPEDTTPKTNGYPRQLRLRDIEQDLERDLTGELEHDPKQGPEQDRLPFANDMDEN